MKKNYLPSIRVRLISIHPFSSEYLGSGDEEVTALSFIDVDDYKGFDFFGTTLSYRALETGTGEGLGLWSLRVGPSLSYLFIQTASSFALKPVRLMGNLFKIHTRTMVALPYN